MSIIWRTLVPVGIAAATVAFPSATHADQPPGQGKASFEGRTIDLAVSWEGAGLCDHPHRQLQLPDRSGTRPGGRERSCRVRDVRVGVEALAERLGFVRLPDGVRWGHIVGIGAVAGIGFTVSLFVTGLAFDRPDLQDDAKVGTLGASIIAAVVGWVVFNRVGRRDAIDDYDAELASSER